MLRSDWIWFYPLTLEAPPLLIVSRHYTKTHISPLRHPPVYIFVRRSSIDYMKFLLTHEGRGGGSNSMHFDRTKDLETPLSLSLIFQSFYFVCCWESVPELSGWKKRAMGKRVPSVPAHTQTAHPDGGTWMVAVCVWIQQVLLYCT
jgi:hypothetical protein